MDILYNYLIEIGCVPDHVSAAVCVLAILSIHVLYKTIISLVSSR